MIRYDLRCDEEHTFDAWFRNSGDYDDQAEKGLVECPHCGSRAVTKAVMAPAVVRGRGERAAFEAFAKKARAHIRDNFDYVGEGFVDEARKMNDGEIEHRPIWGEASPDDARALIEEGAPVAALPAELSPQAPKPKTPRKVN
ncbi:MAG: DUF1178 family protein [Caulobacterales bacterium]|jgi:hypothetical protein